MLHVGRSRKAVERRVWVCASGEPVAAFDDAWDLPCRVSGQRSVLELCGRAYWVGDSGVCRSSWPACIGSVRATQSTAMDDVNSVRGGCVLEDRRVG